MVETYVSGSESLRSERARVLALLKTHGWNATSFQTLEPGFLYWFDREEGCVAYVDTGRAWVAAGAPIASAARLVEVAERFVLAARAAGRRVCFFSTEQRFTGAIALKTVRMGEQPEWDPREWLETVRSTRSLREQLRRATARGVSVRMLEAGELEEPSGRTRRALESLAERWLHSRVLAPMGFLVHLDLFSFLSERRCYVAERDGRIVALLSAVPVYGRGGWFFEDLLREPDAPNGTAELLIDAAMKTAAREDCSYVTLGLAPLAGEVAPPLKFVRWITRGLYDFRGVHAFKAKLRPRAWSPIYVSYPPEQSGVLTVVDVLAAFSREGLLRFGVASLLRGPLFLVRLLALLLVPWTLLLAAAPTRVWFPSPAVHAAWVVFDLGLIAGLTSLLRRWRVGLATLLASLVTLDAMLTSVQAALFNLPRIRSWREALVVLIAVAGPTVAAGILWRARAHRLHQARLAADGT